MSTLQKSERILQLMGEEAVTGFSFIPAIILTKLAQGPS